MTEFWLSAGLLLLAALSFLLIPILRGHRRQQEQDRTALNVALYQERIDALAATLGFVVIAVGVQAPAIMLLAFVPMWLIAVAYAEDKTEPKEKLVLLTPIVIGKDNLDKGERIGETK